MEKCLFCRVQKEKIKEIESENEYFYSTKDSYPVAGKMQLRGALNEYDQSAWKYPEPTKGRR